MLGRQHLLLSLSTAAVVFTTYIPTHYGLVLSIFLGTSIGSLIPDVDAADATVFHRRIKGLNKEPGKAINTIIGPILPLFGYSTKYLIYKPLLHVFNFISDDYKFEEKHRSFSHSFLGVFTMTLVTGAYIMPLLTYTSLFSITYFAGFLCAYMCGAFLHMIQDSCTVTGIAWNTPFSQTHLKGKLKTGGSGRKPSIMLYCLILLLITEIYLITQNYNITHVRIGTLATVSALWLFFLKINSVKLKNSA